MNAESLFAHADHELAPAGGKGKGKPAGRGVAVQGLISVRGWPTGAGSPALEGYRALEDATVVARLRSAGERIVGSTRVSPLGFGLAGDTAAEAVARGKCGAALVIDAMGEALVAAAAAGLVGFRPSWGVVPRLGLVGLIPSTECCGVIAPDVAGAGLVMAAVAGDEPGDFSMPGVGTPDFGRLPAKGAKGAVVGVVREAREAMDRQTADAFAAAVACLEAAGVKVEEVSLPDFPLARSAHQVVGSVEASSATGKYDGVRYGHRASAGKNWNEMYINSRGESFGMPLKAYVLQGALFQYRSYPAFVAAARVRGRLYAAAEALLSRVDALAFPARPRMEAAEAGTVAAVYDLFAWTILGSLCGQPAVTLPGLALADGFDHGLQLVGRRLGDAGLLGLASDLAGAARGEGAR